MKILHINISDAGGAGIACLTLHNELMKQGIESSMLTFTRTRPDAKNVYTFDEEIPDNGAWGMLRKGVNFYRSEFLLKGRKQGYEIFTMPWSARDITQHSAYKSADIIHLHWAHILLDYPSFFRKNKKPVIITIHDMAHFTGGCHVNEDCRGFMDECKNCPQLEGTWFRGQASRNLNIMEKAFARAEKLAVISPARWIMDLSKLSKPLKKKSHFLIRNGINLNIFKPLDKSLARNALGIDDSKLVIATAALNLQSPAKGFQNLLDALRKLKIDYRLIAIGDRAAFPEDIRRKTISLGKVNHQPLLATAYSAADITAIPSRVDVGPQTLQESMACATPVVAFNTTGPAELIKHRDNGWLAEKFDTDDFANGIAEIAENPEKYKNSAVLHARRNFDIEKQTEKIINIYNKFV